MVTKALKSLSVSEKILLVQDLWDDVATRKAAVPVSDDEVQYANRRLKEIERSQETLVSWDALKKRTRKQR